ncbi:MULTISPECIES: phosphocholine-specific phospholipase C [unclassified Bradyrhizobium]|uniref:phosphocholine-specific phospholipase C n=1 Tax=unclassified Bradyrhizobium TaxID=2631580 RepID=UPI0028E99E3E|nr:MULTISPECIES: phospholipase C, phosphocholine-specific [unclassified Bradyrhizobium]
MTNTDRRQFLQMLGAGAAATTLSTNVAKALAIPAHHRTGTIKDVEHIVILMQENRPFDHHFGTLRGVRGFADPRAVKINLPLQTGGAVKASVFLQPASAANIAAGYSVPPNYGNLGGPANGVPVIPPLRIDPQKISAGLNSLGLTYLGGTDHGWSRNHIAWNMGQYDGWAAQKGAVAMEYFTRADIPYHFALADAFTVLDNYYSSILGPTNPNRCYMWTGSIGNVDYVGAGGTDGFGAGPITSNGLPQGHYLSWETFPEVLTKAGVSWKVYQDLAGSTFAPDFGDGGPAGDFSGDYTDNSLLYFAQYANSSAGNPLFDNACTGTQLAYNQPAANAPASAWTAWALSQFDQFKADVQNGTLPQVSWIVAPAGYTEHSSWPVNYGAWYISQVLDILVSKPEVFSKTVFIINYDEADGSFDHVVPPSPPPAVSATPDMGASTVDYHNEIVTTASPAGPIGLGTRVPCLVISPWSKGGYVNSQVFDHTSTIQFIEKRFGVYERNISPWRRAVCGDLTSVFNFKNPDRDRDDDDQVKLPSTAGYLPSVGELSGTVSPPTVAIKPNNVIIGIPEQEKGIRPARALPYELNVYGKVDVTAGTIALQFINSGKAGAVFHVRSGSTTDPVRTYTVEAGKTLSGSWTVTGTYDLTVYGPNGFTRSFKGSVGSGAVALDIRSGYGDDDDNLISLSVRNTRPQKATVTLFDAYTGEKMVRTLGPNGRADGRLPLERFHGWYDLVVTVAEDPHFEYRLTGHVETGRDSKSDPAMGGLLALKA